MKVDSTMTSDRDVTAKLREQGVLVDVVDEAICILLPNEGLRYWDDKITRHDAADLWQLEGFDFRNIGVAVQMAEDGGRSELNRRLMVQSEDWAVNGTEIIDGKGVVEIGCSRREFEERLWICPEKGFSILRRERRSGDKLATLQAEVAERNGVWFPTVVRRAHQTSGKNDYAGVLTVENSTFNMDVPDSEFSIAALGAPPRTRVVDYRTKTEVGVWDGEKIVPFPPLDNTTEPAAAGPFRGGVRDGFAWTKLLWIMALGGLAIAAIISIIRRRQLR